MPELNNMLKNIQAQSTTTEKSLRKLVVDYEALYTEASRIYRQERLASKNMEGLEEFYHLNLILRRNKNVVGSTLRAIKNLRSLKNFEFVEEPEEAPAETKTAEKQINNRELEGLTIEEGEPTNAQEE